MKTPETNLFGGLNPRGLYVPLSDTEQEVLHRLVETRDVILEIGGWGYISQPRILVGEHRIGIPFRLDFTKPDVPQPVWYFDLTLKTHSGVLLYSERMPTLYNNQPVMVSAGMYLELQWDIALHSLDPRFVKALKPGATGLTSRRQDRDTGEITHEGNMRLTAEQRKALSELESAYAQSRADDKSKVERAESLSSGKILLP